jgi:mannose-6-phosphate isomerase-like protein (cupin superfamily)
VCLLSGRVSMVLDRGHRQEVVELTQPGAFVVVPRGTWHTARTSIRSKMLFVTPGQGTENKPIQGYQ